MFLNINHINHEDALFNRFSHMQSQRMIIPYLNNLNSAVTLSFFIITRWHQPDKSP
jgi:hypothetical protein